MNNKQPNIPNGWTEKTVFELCKLGRGRVISAIEIDNHQGIYPVYSSQSFNNGEMGKIDTFDFEGEYVTWTTDGAYAGSVFYRNGKFNCTNVCGTLKLKSPTDSHGFLSYLFTTQAKKYVSYVGNPKLMNGVVAQIPLVWPINYKEQEKIASILSNIDSSIEKTDQLINKYKSIKQGLMQDLFRYGIDENGQIRSEKTHKFKDSPLGRIPEEWDVVNLESVCIPSGMVRGPFGGALKKEIFVKEGFKVYEQGNAIYKTTTLGDYFITGKKYKEMSRFSIKPGDFILSCSGTVGCLYRIPNGAQAGIINQALLKITLNNKLVPELFEYYFESEFRNRIIDSTQGGVINNLVGMSQIRNALLKYIPLPEQEKIATTITSISKSIENEEIYSSKLQSIKQGLMQDLLSGKVRVNHLLN
jgi:type I restriction enzyme S subunit